MCGYDVFTIASGSAYGVSEFKAVRPGCPNVPSRDERAVAPASSLSQGPPHHLQDLLQLYSKAGAKGVPVVLLLTDNQLTKEAFLVFINDLLANGNVPDLCTPEDRDGFIGAVSG